MRKIINPQMQEHEDNFSSASTPAQYQWFGWVRMTQCSLTPDPGVIRAQKLNLQTHITSRRLNKPWEAGTDDALLPSTTSLGANGELRLHPNLVDGLLPLFSPLSVSTTHGALSRHSHTESVSWDQSLSGRACWHFPSPILLPGVSKSNRDWSFHPAPAAT